MCHDQQPLKRNVFMKKIPVTNKTYFCQAKMNFFTFLQCWSGFACYASGLGSIPAAAASKRISILS